jgi:hypothetical protein
MKPRWFAGVLLSTIATIIPGLAQTPAGAKAKPLSPLEQTLIANSKAVGEAEKKKDTDFFKRTLTDDFLEVAADGKVYGRDDIMEGVRLADLQEYSPYDIQVLVVNESAGIVTYDCIVRMTLGDETVPRYQHISDLWIKQGDQWRLKFQQATPAQ